MFSLRVRFALDIGSHKIRFAKANSEDIFDDLNVVAIQHKGQYESIPTAIGAEALIKGEAENLEIVWPVENGVINDFEVAQFSLFLHRRKLFKQPWLFPSQIIATFPTGASEVEKRAVFDVVKRVFGDNIILIEDLLAVGLGLDLDKGEKLAPKFLLQMGAGHTTMGVMANGGLVHSKHIPFAGGWLDTNIQRSLYDRHGFQIGLIDCQRIKHEIGTLTEKRNDEWRGTVRDTAGNSRYVDVSSSELTPALEKGLEFIVAELRWFLKSLPHDILSIGERGGILLSGGCGYLSGISE